ncbi:MAG TPA: hypothetical protein VEX86_12915 [Longimicrobium sp.]|nr:hypothetical protein [Longimicrobium sp.]
MSTEKKPSRLAAAAQCNVSAIGIGDGPALPPVDYAAVGQQAPVLLDTPAGALPQADAVVITWAGAEWAAMQQVFCGGGQAMPYSERKTSPWPGWQQLVAGASAGGCGCYGGKDCYWGYYRLVQVAGRTVLLWKSNVHLDESGGTGQACLEQMMGMLLDQVKPTLVLSLGTAGGSRLADAIGTVNIVNAATLDMGGDPSTWPTYANAWQPSHAVLGASGFQSLLFPTPTTLGDLKSLAEQFDKTCGTTFSLADLDPGGVDSGQTPPAVNDLTPAGTPLLTANSFVTGTTSGQYDAYAVIEMDDAVLWSVCQPRNVAFGSVRNVSDPVQNADLPAETQGNWGEILYNTYGFYTSYNGALAAWAILCAEPSGSAS